MSRILVYHGHHHEIGSHSKQTHTFLTPFQLRCSELQELYEWLIIDGGSGAASNNAHPTSVCTTYILNLEANPEVKGGRFWMPIAVISDLCLREVDEAP